MSVRVGNQGSQIAPSWDRAQGAQESTASVATRQGPAAPRAAQAAPADEFIDGDRERTAQMQAQFQKEFGAQAADKEKFHAFLKQVFGPNYDPALAEEYRQKALNGDYGWLPPIRFVDEATLQGGNAAYDAESGVVLVNEKLRSHPDLAAQVYVEEAGHFLDAQLNHGADAVGDEGELFRKILAGENLSAAQIAAIKADNDHGVITVDGKQVQVEFSIFDDIWEGVKDVGEAVVDGAKAVGGAIVDGAKAVGGAVVDAVKGVGEGILEVGKGILGGVTTFFGGLAEGVGGFFANIVQGRIAEAFDSVVKGLDKAFLQAPHRILRGWLKGAQKAVDGVSHLLGPLGKPVRAVANRAIDIVTTAWDTGMEIARDGFRMVAEAPISVVRGAEKFVKLAAKGEWGEAFKALGSNLAQAITRPIGTAVDITMRSVQGLASGFATALFLEPPARSLNDAEKEMLRKVYGDSIDYDMVRVKTGGTANALAPHTIGSTIYLPTKDAPPRLWDETGRLTEDGRNHFRGTYGDVVDDGDFRVVVGDERSDVLGAHVHENTLYLPDDAPEVGLYDADGHLTSYGRLLAHESAHAWQSQNGGGDYIHKSLWHQSLGAIDGGSRNAAYDWQPDVNAGVAFEDLNPEQQAEFIEDALADLLAGPDNRDPADIRRSERLRNIDPRNGEPSTDLTDGEDRIDVANEIFDMDPEAVKKQKEARTAYLKDSWERIRRGEGTA